jgi:hypothetical protein
MGASTCGVAHLGSLVCGDTMAASGSWLLFAATIEEATIVESLWASRESVDAARARPGALKIRKATTFTAFPLLMVFMLRITPFVAICTDSTGRPRHAGIYSRTDPERLNFSDDASC